MAKDKKEKKKKKEGKKKELKKKELKKLLKKEGKKKGKKKKEKEGKKKKQKTTKAVDTTPVNIKVRKSAGTREVAVVTSDECSAKYTVKIAIARLRRLHTKSEIESFINGETRVTILRVAEEKLSKFDSK